jgi:uncharacterized protein (TIGR00290 family)
MSGGASVVVGWSGGKDSAIALQELRRDGTYDVRALLTTLTKGFDRISMHGVRRELLVRQAEALDLPVIEVTIPPQCANEVYEQAMAAALASERIADVELVAFGDLFLEDVRAYREERLRWMGKRGLFPIWGRETHELARAFVRKGYAAIVCCVDPRTLDGSFAGRTFDDSLLDDLPVAVDPCGENGEFHTFVYDGPIFSAPVRCRPGDIVERGGFVFADVIPCP